MPTPALLSAFHRPITLAGRSQGLNFSASSNPTPSPWAAATRSPGQLVGDFVAGQASTQLGSVEPSYKPGVRLTDLASALPEYAITAMREAIPAFGKKIRGFDMHDAVLTGVETRTSSPLKMTRGDNFQSLNVKGLYPAGEGASYAGGILSAGVDGIEVAEAVARSITGAA